ncbi:hypothetical protein SAMN05444374_11651 [Rhodococcoides kroppenstedtii]|uniref:Uncharacterized protein n=1 Tax=Rhodococcoides kroppenstedtii TaxID=293050 RepID=A0A1I0UAD9_9NOCA|nr:hypothetical protein SAMN05444374_11651 [Rhodococcus kroppenstedtii]
MTAFGWCLVGATATLAAVGVGLGALIYRDTRQS